jgi:1-aminocyclopropane-1-carboxylate deaminase/D-cysteine desulfhydrase-like pyridoxal-dependent ACC family enzyme
LAGLKCILVLSKDKTAGGNLYLSKLYGAEVIQVEGDVKALEKIALDICSNVKDAYYITYGGSNIIGAVSYAFCFSELMNQANSRNIGLSHIFLPVSSMGTLAGLLAGRALYAHKLREAQTYKSVPKIVGASVNPGHVNKDFVIELCKEVISGLKTDKNVPIGDFELSLEFAGKSYALPTRESLDAFLWTKAHCGFLLDHVYGAKAFAALLHYINENLIAPGKNVCYIHTGGAPSLFGYAIL